MFPTKGKSFISYFFKNLLPTIEGDDHLVERVEGVKHKLASDYENIKESQKEEFLETAQKVDSEETTEKLYCLAETTEKQVEETKEYLNVSDEYLQSIVEVIGRK
jgi:hypothetical protein